MGIRIVILYICGLSYNNFINRTTVLGIKSLSKISNLKISNCALYYFLPPPPNLLTLDQTKFKRYW